MQSRRSKRKEETWGQFLWWQSPDSASSSGPALHRDGHTTGKNANSGDCRIHVLLHAGPNTGPSLTRVKWRLGMNERVEQYWSGGQTLTTPSCEETSAFPSVIKCHLLPNRSPQRVKGWDLRSSTQSVGGMPYAWFIKHSILPSYWAILRGSSTRSIAMHVQKTPSLPFRHADPAVP